MLKPAEGLYTQTLGQGVDLVLVHGWGMHSAVWEDFAHQLARHFRVTLIDLPGHGHSPGISSYCLSSVTRAVLEAAPRHAHWLGWSMGSLIVLNIAHQHPERVRRLILVAGSPRFTSDTDWPGVQSDLLERFAQDFSHDYPATLRRFLLMQNLGQDQARVFHKELAERLLACPPPDPAALEGGLGILKSTDLRAVLAGLKHPVLQILGAKDRLTPRALGKAMPRLGGSCVVNVLESAGHLPFLTHPETTLGLICDFLDSAS
ncbi:MAG: pimeloyl-ACP methyl ester esterase BioH [Methylococcaceae bacterium]